MGCGSSKNGGNPTNVTPSMPSGNSNSSDVVQDEEIRRLRDMRNDIVFNAAPDQLVKDKNEGGQKIIVDSIVIPALKKNKFLKDLLTETGRLFICKKTSVWFCPHGILFLNINSQKCKCLPIMLTNFILKRMRL